MSPCVRPSVRQFVCLSAMFEKLRDVELTVNGQSRSIKALQFDRLGMVSY